MTIRYKRLPPWLNLDPQAHRSMMLVICSRVNLPSRIVFHDYTDTWCLAR